MSDILVPINIHFTLILIFTSCVILLYAHTHITNGSISFHVIYSFLDKTNDLIKVLKKVPTMIESKGKKK